VALRPRLFLVGVIASAVALPFASPSVAPAATEFPTGSLALGHPALESEGFAVGGIVSSHVPAVAHTAANELLVTVAPNAKATDAPPKRPDLSRPKDRALPKQKTSSP